MRGATLEEKSLDRVKISIGKRQGKLCEEPASRSCWEKVWRSQIPSWQRWPEAHSGGAGATAPSFFLIAWSRKLQKRSLGSKLLQLRQSRSPAACPKQRDRVFWCARPPLAENQAFVSTTPFSSPFLSEVFSWRLGRRGARGEQPAKMKQLMKRKLLNRQIVLSGWVLCS